MKHRLLLIDDDPLSLASLEVMLEGYLIDTTTNGPKAIEKVKAFGSEYSLVLLDYKLESETGEKVAKDLLSQNPDLFILIYSGDPSREAVKSTWTAGAIGFLEKDSPPSLVRETVALWCAKHRETRQGVKLSNALNSHSENISKLKMVGRSSKMADIALKVEKYKTLKDTVLILGETGTGKECIARALHGNELNSFFPINCASYSSNSDLMEGELFGYTKGAFTGALKDHTGVFDSAHGGTVFLDEIHTLNKSAQQKLLRVLQEKKVRKLGTTKEIEVDFRLVASAKPEIEKLVENEEFLPDLFERLNVLNITVPSLRERKEDIEPLVAYFTAKYEKDTGVKKSLLYKTLRYLENYDWPRNVRELENTVRRLCVNSLKDKIEPEDLEPKFFQRDESVSSLNTQKDDLLKKQIQYALSISFSQREAARQLKIPESTLRRHMKRLEIQL